MPLVSLIYADERDTSGFQKPTKRIANQAFALKRADSIRRGELERVLTVENWQSLGIDQTTCSENRRINFWDCFIVVEQRCLFAAQVLVRFLYRLRRCQEMMENHVPDLNRHCRE